MSTSHPSSRLEARAASPCSATAAASAAFATATLQCVRAADESALAAKANPGRSADGASALRRRGSLCRRRPLPPWRRHRRTRRRPGTSRDLPAPTRRRPSRRPTRPRRRPVVQPAPVVQAVPSGQIGSIDSIEPIRQRPQGSGTGAVVGGVLGAVVGNQFGHGLGRAAMTGVGAAGGAIAGNNVERNYKTAVVGYRVNVRLDNGHTRTFQRTSVGDLHVGDRVRVDANGFRRT